MAQIDFGIGADHAFAADLAGGAAGFTTGDLVGGTTNYAFRVAAFIPG